MKTIVMKFGGSSLADPGRIKRAAASVLAARSRGCRPVVVVSAPADCTDDLLKLAALAGPAAPAPREIDALLASGEQFSAALTALAIQGLGGKAVSLTGAQAGLLTDKSFSSARVLRVNPARLRRELRAGAIPVVAGFQGAASDGDITTLGRGGSDLTAVLLAGALDAAVCEFHTDVKGIYTAHPAIVPDARPLARISYGEVEALAALGTEVRQLRAVALAARRRIPLLLRSSFHDEPGTRVDARPSPPGVTCLSLRKAPGGAAVSLVGSRLRREDRARALAAAAGAGLRVRELPGGPLSCSLLAREGEAEDLLRLLHRALLH